MDEAATGKPKRPIYKKWWFWLLGLIVIIVIASSGKDDASNSTSGTNETNTAPTEQAVAVTATKLYADYKANEISADNSYKGKLVTVSGTVENIGKDILDNPYISLKTGDVIGSVQCMLAESAVSEAGTLVAGATVTMQGRVSGLMMNVIVKDCTLVTTK